MLLERHVFGSIDGYRTLAATSGLTADDCRAIELYQFGNPDRQYIASLSSDPAYVSRPLSAGRRVLTRVMAGRPDDHGRLTLLFVSVVLSGSDWDSFGRDAVNLLHRESLWSWREGQQLDPAEIQAPTRPPDLSVNRTRQIVTLISLVETAQSQLEPICVKDADYSLSDVAAVERLLPPMIRQRLAIGHRVLNPALPLRLMTVPATAVGIPFAASPPELSPYSRTLLAAGLGSGNMRPGVVESYDLFDVRTAASHSIPAARATARTVGAKTMNAPPMRGPGMFVAGSLILGLLLGFAAGFLTGSFRQPAGKGTALLREALSIPSDPDAVESALRKIERRLSEPPYTGEKETPELLELVRRRSSDAETQAKKLAALRQSEGQAFESRVKLERERDRLHNAVGTLEGAVNGQDVKLVRERLLAIASSGDNVAEIRRLASAIVGLLALPPADTSPARQTSTQPATSPTDAPTPQPAEEVKP